ncbi:Ankyrin repeat and BTB/POZ domain-containing protein 1 [Elasticomyces elasticus]|nr:Ankyrin repeat and BTB/POZ domain-containing protein 1 [Elasticomyces elasticus]
MSISNAKPKNQTNEQATEPSTQAPQRYNAIIRILAGEDRESISVHKDVLCRNSDFFVKACSKAWMQEEEDKYLTDGIVTVETVDLTTMDLYIHWKYYDKVDISRIHDVRKEATTGGPRKAHDRTTDNLGEIEELVKLYVAGKYFLESYRLSNQIISELAIRVERWSNGSPFTGESIIDYVWDNTASGELLRSLIWTRAAQLRPWTLFWPACSTHRSSIRISYYDGLSCVVLSLLSGSPRLRRIACIMSIRVSRQLRRRRGAGIGPTSKSPQERNGRAIRAIELGARRGFRCFRSQGGRWSHRLQQQDLVCRTEEDGVELRARLSKAAVDDDVKAWSCVIELTVAALGLSFLNTHRSLTVTSDLLYERPMRRVYE